MTAAEFSALLLLATATSFTPGPNTTLSTAIAANRGLRGAMRFVCEVPTGWAGLFVLCALGVGGLVLAPGASPLRPGLPGIDDQRVFTLRSLEDMDRIVAATDSGVLTGVLKASGRASGAPAKR